MHLNRYTRESVQDALRAAQEDLGPSAVILSTRMVSARGVRGWLGRRHVEVTAAADPDAVSSVRHVDARPVVRDRAIGAIAARLEAAGLDPDLAREVAMAHPAQGLRTATAASIQQAMEASFASLGTGDEAFAPVEVFIGPPGVGKTTTIAKIAARERARNGRALRLVAADGFRVGAVEQLRLYADILGAPLTVARTIADLEQALAEPRRPLLIDTAGRSASDDMSRDMLRYLAMRPDVRTHLVIAADTSPRGVNRIFERFADAMPTRIVVTKLDEADTLGPVIKILRDRRLPISYLGVGQRVPEDLQRATPAALAAWAAGGGLTGAAA